MISKLNIKSLAKSVSFANFFHLLLNQGINVIAALIVTPLLFQRLGEENYAVINLSLTIIMMFTILVNYGFHLNGPKKLALIKNDSRLKETLINEILLTRIFVSVVLILIVFICIGYLGLFPKYSDVLMLSSIILLGEAFFPMFILQGLDKLSWISKANAGAKIIYMIAVALLITSPSETKWVNFLMGSTTLLVNVILLIFIYKKEAITCRWVGLKRIYTRLTENFEFFLSTIAGHVSVHSGLIILSNFVYDVELGRYALAQRVAFLLRMVPVFITQSILQNASRLYREDRNQFESYVKKVFHGGLGLTFVLGIGMALTADWAVRIVGGEYIRYSANVLRVLSFIPFLSTLNVSNMVRILVADYKDVLAKASWIAAICMLLLSVLFSLFWGGMGLAVALLLTEIISFVAHYVLIRQRLKI